MIEFNCILLYKQKLNNNNNKSLPYTQKKMTVKEKEKRIERGNASPYLISLILTPLSLTVRVALLTEAANCTFI
jgi:hypothetical protein